MIQHCDPETFQAISYTTDIHNAALRKCLGICNPHRSHTHAHTIEIVTLVRYKKIMQGIMF